MTKNQINYLLILATLFIFWLFFNTFYVGAKMQSKFPMPMSRSGMTMPEQTGSTVSPFARYARDMNQQRQQGSSTRMPSMAGLSPEAQKMLAERRAALKARMPAPAPIPTSLPTQPTKEKK